MNTRLTLNPLLRSLIAPMLLVGASSFAADQPAATPPASSKEVREQMAAVHERMAACLRSDQAFAACRHEMSKNCPEMLCPMTGTHDHVLKP